VVTDAINQVTTTIVDQNPQELEDPECEDGNRPRRLAIEAAIWLPRRLAS
jgi:hypothetical protein